MREGQQNLKAKDFQNTSGTKNIQAIQGGYPLAKAQYFLLSAWKMHDFENIMLYKKQ